MPVSTDQDVVVIGAGVIGCAIATELSRRGHRTVNVERGPAAGTGSTASSSAVIRFSYSTANGVHVSREGLAYWTNWADHIGEVDALGLAQFHQCGMLLMLSDGNEFAHRVHRLWEELDVPFEELGVDELRRRYPWMSTDLFGPPTVPTDQRFWSDAHGSLTGALLSPDAGYVSDPQLAADNLRCAAQAAGGRFRFSSEVVAIERAAGRVTGVTLADGSHLVAPVVVNVAGPHSRDINELAGVDRSMQVSTAPMRQEVHHVAAPPGVDLDRHGVVMADDDVGFYCRPEVGNQLLIGSIEPECDVLEWVEDPDAVDPNITDLWETQVLRANRRFPDLGMPHRRRGAVGVYDVSDDWMPIYDRTDLDGYYVAIGSSGNQFKNAGVAGQMMGDLIEAVEGGHDHDADPLRSVGRFTGRPLDIGAFSRNRSLNSSSSMSVQG
jgi:sarcosine oxidase subunit beta